MDTDAIGSSVLGPTKYVDKDATILQYARGKVALHLGCVGETCVGHEQRVASYAQSLHYRLSQVCTVVGVDLSGDVISEWREKMGLSGLIEGDVENLSAADLTQRFQVVIASDIIEHLSRPGDMLDGIKPLMANGARLVITTPNAFGLPNYLRYIFGRFREGEQHVLNFNLWSLTNLLNRHGFAVVESTTCHQSRRAKRAGLLFRIGRRLFRVFPKYGGTLFVVATLSPSQALAGHD